MRNIISEIQSEILEEGFHPTPALTFWSRNLGGKGRLSHSVTLVSGVFMFTSHS